jgi:hypothetical protein
MPAPRSLGLARRGQPPPAIASTRRVDLHSNCFAWLTYRGTILSTKLATPSGRITRGRCPTSIRSGPGSSSRPGGRSQAPWTSWTPGDDRVLRAGSRWGTAASQSTRPSCSTHRTVGSSEPMHPPQSAKPTDQTGTSWAEEATRDVPATSSAIRWVAAGTVGRPRRSRSTHPGRWWVGGPGRRRASCRCRTARRRR